MHNYPQIAASPVAAANLLDGDIVVLNNPDNPYDNKATNLTQLATKLGNLDAPSLAVTAGVGITGGTGTVYKQGIQRFGNIIKTTILVDLTGLNGGGTAGDIIGTNGAGAAHLGQITTAQNGTIFGGLVTCLEVPTTSDPDVDLWSANEATGVEDTAISALTGEIQLTNGGDHTLARQIALLAVPTNGQYLYLAGGDATAGTYDAGQFLIELYGYV